MEAPQRLEGTELERINALTERIIGAAIEVHRVLGPGLLESMYETAMCIELDDRGVKYSHQVSIPAYYKGRLLGDYRVDFIVENLAVVEIKSVTIVLPVFKAQLLTYMRLTAKRVGLIMNFNSRLMKEGIDRLVL